MKTPTSILIEILIRATFELGQRIEAHGHKLRIIPGEGLSPDFIATLQAYKYQLLAFLKLPDKERRALVEREPLPPPDVRPSQTGAHLFPYLRPCKRRSTSVPVSLLCFRRTVKRPSDLYPCEADRLNPWCGPDGDPSLVLEAVRLFNAKVVRIEPSNKFVPHVHKKDATEGGENNSPRDMRHNNP